METGRAAPVSFWRHNWIALALVSVVAILIAGIVVLMLLRPPPQERRQVTRFTITTPQSAPLWITRAFNDIAISPDGTHVAYVCQVGTRQQLCLRPVDQLEATCFPSTGGSILFTPFFSPDGKEIGFYADSDLKKVSVRDGQATTLRADSPVLFGAVWAEDGTILYGSPNQELHRIPDSGGDPVPLSILDRDKQERAHVWPELLPGGKAILVTILAGWNRQIALLDPVTHEHRVLFLGSNPHYSPGGHIVYSHEISPNGKWMAYQSDESDQWEIYVRPFPEVNEGKWKVSNNGGSEPGWAPDGRELFYRDGDRMMVVPIRTEPSFSSGIPKVVFEGSYLAGGSRQYDVSSDGQRFLMIKEGGEEGNELTTKIVVVQNWSEELESIATY